MNKPFYLVLCVAGIFGLTGGIYFHSPLAGLIAFSGLGVAGMYLTALLNPAKSL